jgi:tricorn protease-like protein
MAGGQSVKNYIKSVLLLSAAILPTSAFAQAPAAADDKAPKWDVAAPPGLTLRQINIDTDEGSWMNLDVSPDGKTITFDLLGDIYVIPVTGGTPTRIAEGLPFETQPRFSPDGNRIAFTSDRGGGDNIWIMNRDGSDKRQLSKEDFRLLNQPSWSPDGRSIAAGKLADLVILDADPSVDIRNSDKVAKVMIGGRLYDAATLNEEVTGTRKRMPYYWE